MTLRHLRIFVAVCETGSMTAAAAQLFICSAGHVFAGRTLKGLGEIKDQDFMLREKGSAGREIFDGLAASQELAITPVWQSASNQAIIHGVKEGLGISLLPYFVVQESMKRGEIAEFKIEGLALNRKFSAIYHKNKFLPRSAAVLMGLCRGRAGTNGVDI